jgi:hypothetical protein
MHYMVCYGVHLRKSGESICRFDSSTSIILEGLGALKFTLVSARPCLLAPNGAGKSTVLEAFALLFGRDRLVRTLTEHDFCGSNPAAGDRIPLTATVTGFSSNTAADHGQWFSERRGVPKWLTASGNCRMRWPDFM